MRTLKTILLPALAATMALGAALPAQAHMARPPAQHGPNHATPARAESIRNQIEQLRTAVNRNDNRDRISEREAAALRRDVDALRDQFRRYNRNGLSNAEFRTLNARIEAIRARLHVERRDRDHHRN